MFFFIERKKLKYIFETIKIQSQCNLCSINTSYLIEIK